MDINNIINELNRLEMRGGCNVLPETLRLYIITALQQSKPNVKRGRPAKNKETPEVIGKAPE